MKHVRHTIAKLLATAGVACLAAQPAYAASSWLSTVTTIENGARTTYSAGELSSRPLPRATSTTAVFDLSISLEENPQGDDEYPEEPTPATDDDDQNKFEKKIEEFADAVFQMTNGKHKIGKVTIFRDGDQANNTDVQWKENCTDSDPTTTAPGPRANPSGFGVAGARIYFCTNWEGAPRLMDTPKGAGFTLAHEWGHYTYGIYDEYVANCGQTPETNCVIFFPRSTDTASSPSIMNGQWTAVSGSQDWLEVSTLGVEPYATQADGDDKNGQARVFGENGWATLTRDPATDPRNSFLPTRTQYTNLVAPTAPNLIVNDDESTARSELDIIWAGNQVAELMIDTSGSMSGTPISNAKTAASLLVGQLTPGENAVGVGRFTSSATQVFAITDIPDPDTGVRSGAQTAIAAFSAGGGTDIEDAALTALAQVQGFQGGTRPSVVYLLTDGQSSVNQTTVINAYTAAKVPLVTFGFGSGVNAGLLQSLANGTGGQYFFSPTTLAQIQQAFVAANAAFSSSVVVQSTTAAATASTTDVRNVTLDSSLATAAINVSFAGAVTDVSLRLLDGTGADTGAAFTCNAGAEVSCDAEVDVTTLGAGQYGVEVVNNTSSNIDVSVLVSGTPSDFESYDIAVEFNNVNYPQSFAIEATVTDGPAITGLDVTATVTKPDSSTVNLPLLDDGKNSDRLADDGTYTADVPYDMDGTYTAVVTAENTSGNAQTTFTATAISVDENGNGVTPTPTNITEMFTRVAVTNAAVTGVAPDDHSNDPSVPGACTAITDNNVDTAGRIDAAGDVDCFFFTPTSTANDLIARVTSLALDMQPVVRVYDATGGTELLTVDLSTSANAASGAVATVPASSLDAAGHVVTVEHADATAAMGNYAVSVGAKLASDEPVKVPDGGGNGGGGGGNGGGGGGSGGGIGPWGVMFAALLALIGLRQRRRIM